MRSDQVKKGFDRAPHRSLFRATGVTTEDFSKPFIGVANSYIDIIPGHFFLAEYGKIIKDEIKKMVVSLLSLTRLGWMMVLRWGMMVCFIRFRAVKLLLVLLKQS